MRNYKYPRSVSTIQPRLESQQIDRYMYIVERHTEELQQHFAAHARARVNNNVYVMTYDIVYGVLDITR